ncbi:hypothetical protein D9M69_294620 [compost metagenome]
MDWRAALVSLKKKPKEFSAARFADLKFQHDFVTERPESFALLSAFTTLRQPRTNIKAASTLMRCRCRFRLMSAKRENLQNGRGSRNSLQKSPGFPPGILRLARKHYGFERIQVVGKSVRRRVTERQQHIPATQQRTSRHGANILVRCAATAAHQDIHTDVRQNDEQHHHR